CAAASDGARRKRQYAASGDDSGRGDSVVVMRIDPDPEAFAAAYAAGRPQVVWTRFVADLETPVSAYLKLCEGRANAFLLESVEGGATRGRYSMIGLKPDVIWRCNGKTAEINRTPDSAPED